jgi:hypothetical protein
MSSLITAAREGARTRVPRFAEAAVERARLTVVPPRRAIGRTQAARTPFAVAGDRDAGRRGGRSADVQHQHAAGLVQGHCPAGTGQRAHRQGAVPRPGARPLRDPQRLAVAAKDLGMVAPSQPAFVRLATAGCWAGPTPANRATPCGSTRCPKKPPAMKRKTVIVKVPATEPAGGSQRRLRAPTPPAPPPLDTSKAVGRRPARQPALAPESGASH